MKPVKKLMKLHKRIEKLKRFKVWANNNIKRTKKEMKDIMLTIPDTELLQYGELMGYMEERK